ncbi:MAG TPA: hypothetical protein IGS17_07435 [Oscillatoriales cyanobacterium M59_W2019_021]|nr:MAG: hypothetical protein D6728_16125 [Cyanobacteria bacterium J055]HIK31216.1 hypothetical protein [Oscillatoriales cyanobacterium M4454_W2019_049]HIK50743.1 hypothetical protein [Oscillatoriales cyanobacterium M59_W2019_021]
MTNPPVHAFFIGRVLAEEIGAAFEKVLTNGLSELGKFDAEQRESLSQFTERVIDRARQAEESAMQGRPVGMSDDRSGSAVDWQASIDDLRAEIAQLRTELQRYRSRST